MKKLILGLAAALFALLPVAAAAQSVSAPGFSPPVSASCGTVTVSTPCLDLSQAWSGTSTLTLLKANITADPGPANSGSLLLDLQYLGVSKWNLSAGGVMQVAGSAKMGASGVSMGTSTNSIVMWNGGALSWSSAATLSAGQALGDVQLWRDAANTLACRNGTSPCTVNVYNTYTDSSNYERGIVQWSSNALVIGTENAGTGSVRGIKLSTAGTTYLGIGQASGVVWNIGTTGHLTAGTDNTYDIGASGANRPRDVYIARYVQMGTTTVGSLKTCNAAAEGSEIVVTDANATTFHSTVAPGGSNHVKVVCLNSAWTIGG